MLISVKLSTLGVRSHLCPRPPCSFGLPGSLSICEANKASPSMLADALDRNFYPKAGPGSVKYVLVYVSIPTSLANFYKYFY